MNWNDLKFFLALYRAGTLADAAVRLKVNSTTVARRIQQLEQDLGSRLFQKEGGRYLPNENAEAVLSVATGLEEQFNLIDQRLGDRDLALSGSLRITSVSTFINGYLLARVSDFKAKYPNIQLELIADSSQLSLGRREADLAIRMGRPETGNLVIRKLVDIAYAVYGQAGVSEHQPLKEQSWVCLDEQYADLPEARWVEKYYKNCHIALRTNVGVGSVEAVRQGLGVACLPCYLANYYGLVPYSAPMPMREIWLLQHPGLTSQAKCRAFIDWLIEQLAQDRALFAGG